MSLSITEVHREAINRINDDNDNFDAIYNAILAKGGSTTQNDRSDYAPAILALNSGGSTLITKNINQNGTYNASDDNADGYSEVTVAVPEKTLTTKQINNNGVYNASDDNADGYSQVIVNTGSPTIQSNKEMNIDSAGTTVVSPDSGYDALAQVTINAIFTPNLQEKEVTTNGEVTPDSGYDGLSKVTVNVQHTPNNQNKTVNIDSNGTTQVTSDQGYDGLGTVTINARVNTITVSGNVSISDHTIYVS